MKKSGFLIREQQIRQQAMNTAERVTQQILLDTLQITLHTEFGFGYDRIKRVTEAWGACYKTYHDALTGGPEADYYQEHLDRQLLDVLKDRQPLIPFRERYPEIKEIKYERKKR
jgi:hypothetical protein